MSSRIWEEPFFSRTSKPLRNESHREAKERFWDEEHERYRRLRDER
jgi:hypothetical protein